MGRPDLTELFAAALAHSGTPPRAIDVEQAFHADNRQLAELVP